MILNSGLDAACTNHADSGSGTSPNEAHPYFCQFIQYAAFGTGSTEPSPEQTTLDAQVGSRSNSRGGFSNSTNAGLDAENNLIWYEATFTRVFNITSAVNATEWGLSAGSTSNLSVRDLFREDPNDPDSDAVTISLDEGDQLQLVVTLRVEAAWEYETKSFVITGTAGNDAAGTHTGNATVSTGASTTESSIREALRAVWPGGGASSTSGGLRVVTSDQSSVAKNQDTSSAAASVSLSAESYTPGSFYRDYTGMFTTAQANADHYAWFVTLAISGSTGVGYRFILTNPATLTKTNTHRLTLTFRRSIARL